MSDRTFHKDPDGELDFYRDWSAWLNGDTIASSTWTVPTGLTKVSDTFDSTKAKIVLRGGTAGQSYEVANRITTAANRTDERTFTINVLQR